MTSSYAPPPPPRRLTRSRTNKVAGGVCGGVAHYVNMDPTLVRVLTVLITLVTGPVPLVLYLVAMFVMPQEDAPTGPYPSVYPPPPARGADPVWGTEGAPWEQATQRVTPPDGTGRPG